VFWERACVWRRLAFCSGLPCVSWVINLFCIVVLCVIIACWAGSLHLVYYVRSPEEVWAEFQSARIPWEDYAERSEEFLADPELTIRVGEDIMPWREAQAYVAGLLFYGASTSAAPKPTARVTVVRPPILDGCLHAARSTDADEGLVMSQSVPPSELQYDAPSRRARAKGMRLTGPAPT